MLDPEFKAKWVEALESGKYPQAKRFLYNGTGYCCLGVACLVKGATFQEDTSDIVPRWNPMLPDGKNLRQMQTLAPKFREEIGLDEDSEGKLVTMNDGGDSFQVIADYIKANL